jgi:hypothetical protein
MSCFICGADSEVNESDLRVEPLYYHTCSPHWTSWCQQQESAPYIQCNHKHNYLLHPESDLLIVIWYSTKRPKHLIRIENIFKTGAIVLGVQFLTKHRALGSIPNIPKMKKKIERQQMLICILTWYFAIVSLCINLIVPWDTH